MSEITMFDFEGAKIRAMLDAGGKPWFVANDIAKALGYEDARRAVIQHVSDHDRAERPVIDSMGRNQRTNCINEAGMYALVMSSRLPSAQRFKDWVHSEVLPSIGRTGSYSMRNPALPSRAESQIAVHSLLRGVLVQAGVIPQMASAAMLRACVADGLLSEEAEREYRVVLGVDWDDSPTLTPTQIGKELGGLTPVQVNKMLETRGLQKNAARSGERPRWEPTEEGKPYCGAIPFKARNEHTGMQLKWSPRVLHILREPLADPPALPVPKPQEQFI